MNKYTLLSIIGAGLLVSTAAMATDPALFQAEKEREIGNMQERIQLGQERLACVQAATDSNALKACHQAAKAKMDVLEAKIKAQVSENKAARAAHKAATAMPTSTPPTH
jgi:hypothetical protein